MRPPLSTTSRSSTVTNAVVQAILPFIQLTDEEIGKALRFLGQRAGELECVYCGAGTSSKVSKTGHR